MNLLRLLPVVLSIFLLGAHFLRHGLMPVVVLILLSPALLFFKRAWAARLIQSILVLGTLEWIRTVLILIDGRRSTGESWARLATILLTIAAFTACSALLFRCGPLKTRYRLEKIQRDESNA